jgi:hypothetical protein
MEHKTNINTFYVKALDERQWVDKKWRKFQDFMLELEPRDIRHINKHLLQIEKYLVDEKNSIQ